MCTLSANTKLLYYNYLALNSNVCECTIHYYTTITIYKLFTYKTICIYYTLNNTHTYSPFIHKKLSLHTYANSYLLPAACWYCEVIHTRTTTKTNITIKFNQYRYYNTKIIFKHLNTYFATSYTTTKI